MRAWKVVRVRVLGNCRVQALGAFPISRSPHVSQKAATVRKDILGVSIHIYTNTYTYVQYAHGATALVTVIRVA